MRAVRVTTFFLIFLIVTLVSLGARCFYLQYFKANHYRRLSLKQQRARTISKAQRGAILDSRGRVLAASNKRQTIFAEPRAIKDIKSTSAELAEILDMEGHKICELIRESRNPGFVKIKAHAEPKQCDAARKIHGIGVQTDWQRYYPVGALTSHIVGFTSTDNRGLGGIELQYDKQLSGVGRLSVFLADARRRPVRLLGRQDHNIWASSEGQTPQNITTQQPRDGVGIILTLDATIQQFARSELIKQYEAYEAESAVAIVAEPKTGAILAMVSLDDFEPNKAAAADANDLRNRAITDTFEPGSILKPIAAAIALDSGAVGLDEQIYCEQGNYHGKGFGRIGEYSNRRYGNLSVREILVHSSNIGMAKIGQKTGRQRLHKGLELFGFGRKTKVDLPGEAPGLLRPAHKWTGYSVTRIPFGQEISVTAIQVVRAFCILANGGRAVRPYLVRAIVGNDGEIIELKHPAPDLGFIVKPEVARWITQDALVKVVNEGTGKKARLDKWQVFGKTGTANIAKSDEKGYSQTDYVASFAGGAPAEQPAVVVFVSIRKPRVSLGKGYTGGTVAAPVAGRILEKTLTCLEKNQRQIALFKSAQSAGF